MCWQCRLGGFSNCCGGHGRQSQARPDIVWLFLQRPLLGIERLGLAVGLGLQRLGHCGGYGARVVLVVIYGIGAVGSEAVGAADAAASTIAQRCRVCEVAQDRPSPVGVGEQLG